MAWFGREHDPSDDDPTAAIRAAIATLTEARAAAARTAAAALVNQAQASRALAQQRAELDRSLADVGVAVAAAERVAADTRATDGAPAAAPYEQHVAGLHTQREVLLLARDQIDGLRSESGEYVARARELLVTSRRDLDDALREQVRLLVAVERLQRARAIAAARARRAQP